MKQNEKELLLKDLCGRLPYGVKVESVFISPDTKEHKPCGIELFNETCLLMIRDGLGEFKPYLFPLSSMTEEQKEEYEEALVYHDYIKGGWTIAKTFDDEYIIPYWFVDFCNKNHLDYRNLIPMGLAIDASKLNIY